MSVIKKTKNNYKTKSKSNKSSTSRKNFNKSRNSRNKTRKMRGGTVPLTPEQEEELDAIYSDISALKLTIQEKNKFRNRTYGGPSKPEEEKLSALIAKRDVLERIKYPKKTN